MKQKTTALLLVLAMVMSLFAGQQYQKTEVQAAQNNTEEVIINTGMPTTTVEPTAEPTAEPTEEPIAFPTEKPDEKPAAPVLTEAVTSEKGIYVRFSQVKMQMSIWCICGKQTVQSNFVRLPASQAIDMERQWKQGVFSWR